MSSFNIEPNLIGKFLTRKTSVSGNENEIRINSKASVGEVIKFEDIVDIPQITLSFLGYVLTITTSHKVHTFRFLSGKGLSAAKKAVEHYSIKSLTVSIKRLESLIQNKVIDQYLRDSSIQLLDLHSAPIIERYHASHATWDAHFDQQTLAILSLISKNYPFETNKNELRSRYEQNRLHLRKAFYDTIESNPLTSAQREAVVRNNDRNLVLAAAGTGKTSVMVSKCIDLIDTGECAKDDILVLAYNKSAAIELRERVIDRGLSEENLPTISTFHALGRMILKESNVVTYLSDFVEDPIKLTMWVTQWITGYIKSSPESMRDFIELAYQPVNAFDFTSKDEYDRYVIDNEYRTLQGERVRGYQELLIANWLFLNCVNYVYEDPYVTKRRVEVGFDYRPDFHLTDHSIYIEHFGIDRHGNTRADIDKARYARSMQDKRNLHHEMGTILLETYHYDWVEGQLETRLERQLAKYEVQLKKKSDDEVFKSLNELGFVQEGAKRYVKCLQAIRAERLDEIGIKKRLDEKGISRADKYTNLLVSLHDDYVNELGRQGKIDFDDMIIKAIDCIKNSRFIPSWRHILVDEFQDISNARMELINALVEFGPHPILTVVGDDWQSIYRFSGGKLELTTRFEELVGSHTVTRLEKTFRYNSSIADVAGTFVMQNPEQYKKQVVTSKKVDVSQVYILDSNIEGIRKNPEEKVVEVIKAIRKKDEKGSIAILARYNYLLANAKEIVNSFNLQAEVKFWSFHKAKGLEADYCILIGFNRGKTGFPNENKEEAVIEALLPSLDTYPHSEERRLLYVALTRARNKSYLIADPMAPSEFINELLTPRYKVHIASKTFSEVYRKMFKCPLCTTGYFRIITGKHGEFYSCSSGQVCKSKPRMCEKCNAPSIDHRDASICNNEKCNHKKSLCDRCGRPMKLRAGRFGNFLGCSGYGIQEDQCKNTRKYFA